MLPDPYTDELRCLSCNTMFPIEALDADQLCEGCGPDTIPCDYCCAPFPPEELNAGDLCPDCAEYFSAEEESSDD